MKKMNRAELISFREKLQKTTSTDSYDTMSEIIVGVGTCGIAAGAMKAIDAFTDEIQKQGLQHIHIKQTGCMGFCSNEPTVEVHVPGMPDIVYGDVSDMIARRIVTEHIIAGKLVSGHVFNRPSPDIVP